MEALAAAPEQEVLALLERPGILFAAPATCAGRRGRSPRRALFRATTRPAALPGIGDYTAAAIASIAFGLPQRWWTAMCCGWWRGWKTTPPISGRRAHPRALPRIARTWLDRGDAGAFNQALMELGATVCLPRDPLCLVCPLVSCCEARRAGRETELPVKLRKAAPQKIDASW